MGKDQISRQTPDITAEACGWIAQLETGELTTADLEAFREWIRRSPRHAAEIKQLALMSRQLNVLTDMAGPLQKASEESRLFPIPWHKSATFSLPRLAVITVVAACMVTASLFLFPVKTLDTVQLISTTVGEYRDINLSDGTQVRMNTTSQIEVDYQSHIRKVRLLAGEVFFDVAPDSTRPFLVYVNDKYVRALGTAFLVRLVDKEIEVLVTEGRVELAETPVSGTVEQRRSEARETVDPNDAYKTTAPVPVALKAGQRIVLSAIRKLNPVVAFSARDQKRELSWQEGLHDFANTPLDEVVRELSRHNRLNIEIADPALRELKFSGIFRIGETEPLFDALQEFFGINVLVDGNHVVLSLAQND